MLACIAHIPSLNKMLSKLAIVEQPLFTGARASLYMCGAHGSLSRQHHHGCGSGCQDVIPHWGGSASKRVTLIAARCTSLAQGMRQVTEP
jgi:hypothetical protein